MFDRFHKLQIYSIFSLLFIPITRKSQAFSALEWSVLGNVPLMQLGTLSKLGVNKQPNLTVKNKPHTTSYIYCIFEVYFMIKSV